MEKNCYTAIQTDAVDDAVDMFGDSIELVQIDNNLTDNGHTYVNANRNGFIDRWNSEKINKVAKLFGCEIIDNKIMSGKCKNVYDTGNQCNRNILALGRNGSDYNKCIKCM